MTIGYGVLGGGGSNFFLSHWLSSSPLQHSRTTVRACDSCLSVTRVSVTIWLAAARTRAVGAQRVLNICNQRGCSHWRSRTGVQFSCFSSCAVNEPLHGTWLPVTLRSPSISTKPLESQAMCAFRLMCKHVVVNTHSILSQTKVGKVANSKITTTTTTSIAMTMKLSGLGREGRLARYRRRPACRTGRVRIPSASEGSRRRTSPADTAPGKRLHTHTHHLALELLEHQVQSTDLRKSYSDLLRSANYTVSQ